MYVIRGIRNVYNYGMYIIVSYNEYMWRHEKSLGDKSPGDKSPRHSYFSFFNASFYFFSESGLNFSRNVVVD